MKNIELKILLDKFNEVISLLRRIKARYVGRVYQTDIYYYCNTGHIKLRNVDNKNFELILYQRSNKRRGKISDYQIFNVNLGQVNDIKHVFDKIFGRKALVKKERELWLYKNTRIHLDRIRNLGRFLELETMVRNNGLRKARLEFNEVVKLLNLRMYQHVRKSYGDLGIQNQINLKK